MCELTAENFAELYSEIKSSLLKARFISIDLEFSGLQVPRSNAPSLFDSNIDRYNKLRKNFEHIIPVQVGLTAFHFYPDQNEYFGEVYNFYTFPACFNRLDKCFFFQSSSIKFLCLHDFDFNKFAYSGIPFVNAAEEDVLRNVLGNGNLCNNYLNIPLDVVDTYCKFVQIITKWYKECKAGDYLEISEFKKFEKDHEIKYIIHKKLRSNFKNLWTYESQGHLFVRIVTPEEYTVLNCDDNLEERTAQHFIGFRRIFKLLTSLKKPIVGHNVLQDLMIMINNFEGDLPQSYSQFKKLAHTLFPAIFDTKTLYYELRNDIEKRQLSDNTSLEGLFSYFKDGNGRHLVENSPLITCNVDPDGFGRYHEAGWDSFCAGYVFVRCGHFNIARHHSKTKTFVSSELISGLAQYKNCVNVIRGSTGFIKIDGDDPISKRPPWLIIESLKDESLDVFEVASLLSPFGSVDVKKISKGDNRRVLVAVDNFRTARQISNNFKTHPHIQIKQYNAFKHDPAFKKFMWAALTISGSLLVWTIVKN